MKRFYALKISYYAILCTKRKMNNANMGKKLHSVKKQLHSGVSKKINKSI